MQKSKQEMVLSHLKKYKQITPLEALELYGSFRLGAIIYNLREFYNIETERITVNTRFGFSTVARYRFKGKKK